MLRLQQHHPNLIVVTLWSVATHVIKGTLTPVPEREIMLDLDSSQRNVGRIETLQLLATTYHECYHDHLPRGEMCKLQICQERLRVPKHIGKLYIAMAYSFAECKQAHFSHKTRSRTTFTRTQHNKMRGVLHLGRSPHVPPATQAGFNIRHAW